MLSPAASYNTQHQTPPPSFLARPPPLGILRDISDLILEPMAIHISDMLSPPKPLHIFANSAPPLGNSRFLHIHVLQSIHVLCANLFCHRPLSYEVHPGSLPALLFTNGKPILLLLASPRSFPINITHIATSWS